MGGIYIPYSNLPYEGSRLNLKDNEHVVFYAPTGRFMLNETKYFAAHAVKYESGYWQSDVDQSEHQLIEEENFRTIDTLTNICSYYIPPGKNRNGSSAEEDMRFRQT
jgi:hypothetical protein